jgi:PhnB protein
VTWLAAHIVVRDAARAAEWYADAFGARELARVPVPDGRLMSVELHIGDAVVMLADEFAEMGVLSASSVGGTATVLTLHVDDAEAFWRRAVDAGAEVHSPLHDAFWGERHGQLDDPFGHRWGVAQRLRDVPHDEVVRATAELFR